MSFWHHRNPLKATTLCKFDLSMVAAKPEAVQICSDLRQCRKQLIDYFADLASNPDQVDECIRKYISLLLGFVEALDKRGGEWSKMRHLIMFKWTQSLLGNVPLAQKDSVFELISIMQEYAIWLMKFASNLASAETVSEDDAKKVYKSLLKAAGLFKFAQSYFDKLLDKAEVGCDQDPRIANAYIHQCMAEAQEVTIARAIELKHSSVLIAALCAETARLFQAGVTSLASLESSKFGKWSKYLELKASYYNSYAYCYHGDNLLSLERGGEAVRSLQESEKILTETTKHCKEYTKMKGVGIAARPETHPAFRKLQTQVKRIKEKCERENGMIYHQKVSIEKPLIDSKATHGLVSATEFEKIAISSLWTEQAYSAFDLSQVFNEKLKDKQNQAPLPEVKEKNVKDTAKEPKNESGCILQ